MNIMKIREMRLNDETWVPKRSLDFKDYQRTRKYLIQRNKGKYKFRISFKCIRLLAGQVASHKIGQTCILILIVFLYFPSRALAGKIRATITLLVRSVLQTKDTGADVSLVSRVVIVTKVSCNAKLLTSGPITHSIQQL